MLNDHSISDSDEGNSEDLEVYNGFAVILSITNITIIEPVYPL